MAVGIVIPLYNTSAQLLERALGSIVAQTKKCLVFVVDDGSDNDYKKVLDTFNSLLNIYWYRSKKNLGPGSARDLGIEMAYKTCAVEHIMFLDADDILMPQAVETLLAEARVRDADIVTSQIYHQSTHREKDKIIGNTQGSTWLHGKIYKMSFLRKHNINFNSGAKFNEDTYFNTIAFGLSENIYSVEEVFYIWCYNKDSITRNENYNFSEKYRYDYFISLCGAVSKLSDAGKVENLEVLREKINNLYIKETDEVTKSLMAIQISKILYKEIVKVEEKN